MRSLLRFLFGRRLSKHPDSFALTRKKLWESIGTSIKLQQSMGKSVWLVVHFPETYLQCQTMLEELDINYIVETDLIDEHWMRELASTSPTEVRLLLGDLVRTLHFESDELPEFESKVALMVAERHPYGPMNDRILQFAESIPAGVEIGHFMALDDALVQEMVPEQMVDLLKAMGLDDNDLISSAMVTRLLDRRIRQTTNRAVSNESANSAAEWFELNGG